MNKVIVETEYLRKYFKVGGGLFARDHGKIHAVDGVGLRISEKESLGIVGESGCGKTTLGRLILGLDKPDRGRVLFKGKDLSALSASELRSARRHMQVIFQDPFSSLNPRMTVSQIIAEPLVIHRICATAADMRRRVLELVELVGLSKKDMERYPHQFSGGQRQRIGIARALALNPSLVVADEPVSSLDVSIQAQILNLLKGLQKQFNFSYLLISHDFSVVKYMCHRVGVMYLGKIVEMGRTEDILSNPQHPYTEALLSAVPIADPAAKRMGRRVLLSGEVPNPADPPPGCRFHPRCRYAEPLCRDSDPEEQEISPGWRVKCRLLPFRRQRSASAIHQGDSD